MSEQADDLIQIVVRRKPRLIIYPRSPPSTLKYPKDAQLETRIKFAQAASKAKDKKGLEPNTGLPWAAYYVKKILKGFESPNKIEVKPLWKRKLENLQAIMQLIVKLRQISQ